VVELVQQEQVARAVPPVQQELTVQVDTAVILRLGNIQPTPILVKIQQMAILD